jgi:hypothetical protein
MDSCHIANYTLPASTQVPNVNYRVSPHHRRIEWSTAGVSGGCSLRCRKRCPGGNQYHEQRILDAAEFLQASASALGVTSGQHGGHKSPRRRVRGGRHCRDGARSFPLWACQHSFISYPENRDCYDDDNSRRENGYSLASACHQLPVRVAQEIAKTTGIRMLAQQ